ncbi:hypothetical protein [Lactobacillus delbrueckii]
MHRHDDDENEIIRIYGKRWDIRIYGKRWDIEVFFKTCKGRKSVSRMA